MMRADGRDDPSLAQTAWPLPDAGESDRDSIESQLRYGQSDRGTLLAAAGIVTAYGALIADGTTTQQTRRLAALRRVYRRRIREHRHREPGRRAAVHEESVVKIATVSDPPPITAEDIARIERESEQLHKAFEARTKGMERVEGRRRR